MAKDFSGFSRDVIGARRYSVLHFLDGSFYLGCCDRRYWAIDGVSTVDWRVGEFFVADLGEVLAPSIEDGRWVTQDLLIDVFDMLHLADVLR